MARAGRRSVGGRSLWVLSLVTAAVASAAIAVDSPAIPPVPLEPVTISLTDHVRQSRIPSPILMTRSFARDFDLDIPAGGDDHPHGYIGRLGTVPNARAGCTIALDKDGDEVFASFRVDRADPHAREASVQHAPAFAEQFQADSQNDLARRFTQVLFQADMVLFLPDVALTRDQSIEVVMPRDGDDTSEAMPLTIWDTAGGKQWFLRGAGFQGADIVGHAPVPPNGRRFLLRYVWKKSNGAAQDGVFRMWQSEDSGETWTVVFNQNTLRNTPAIERIWMGIRREGRPPGGTLDPELRVFEYGFLCSHGFRPGAGEGAADRRLLLPHLDGWSDDALFDLITHDPLWGVMTLDVSETAARVRLQLDPNERTASWTDLFGFVRYGTSPGGPYPNTSPTRRLASNAAAGYVKVIGIQNLAPDKTYYYQPVFSEALGGDSRRYEPEGEFSFHTKPTQGGGRQRYVFVSCAKSWGPHLPHPVFHFAAHPEDTGLPDDLRPIALVLQDDINYVDDDAYAYGSFDSATEGGPAYLVEDYDRLYRQWFETPLLRDARRTMAFHLTYGDHLVQNNWDKSWWGVTHGFDTDATGEPFTRLPPSGPGYRHAGMTRGKLVDNAMNWFARSFWDGQLGRAAGRDETTYHNPGGAGHILPQWRRWRSGPIDFLQIDTRSFANDSAATVSAMLGDDQQQWLTAALQDDTTPLKVILSPSPVSNFVTNSDNWEGYPEARERLLEAIADMPHGVLALIIAGDRHCPQILTKVRNDAMEGVELSCKVIADIVAAPLASRMTSEWQREGTVMDTDADVIWCLRGSNHLTLPENNRTDGKPLVANDMMRTLTVVDFDDATQQLDVYMLDGVTGAIMDDGKGNPGIATFSYDPQDASACPGDIDEDCRIGFADLLLLLAEPWGEPSDIDVTGDGVVGFADLLVVLSAWGDC